MVLAGGVVGGGGGADGRREVRDLQPKGRQNKANA